MRSTEREDDERYRAASSAHAGRCYRGAKSGTSLSAWTELTVWQPYGAILVPP
jgi:hypothetical protein